MLWETPQLAARGGADCIPTPASEQGRGSSARLKTELIFTSPLLFLWQDRAGFLGKYTALTLLFYNVN